MSDKTKCSSVTNNDSSRDISILEEAKRAHQKFQKLVAERVNKCKNTYTAEEEKILEQIMRVEKLEITALTNYSLVTEYNTSTSQELLKLRKLSQSIYDVNTDVANTRKSCEQSRNQCKINMCKLKEQFDNFKVNSNRQLSAEEDAIRHLKIEIENDRRYYENTSEDVNASINSSKIILQSEEIEFENIREEYSDICKEYSALGVNLEQTKKSNDNLSAEYFEKNKLKDSILADIVELTAAFENEIIDFKTRIEDTDIKYQNANEELEKLQEAQSTQDKVIENLVIAIKETDEQLCSYKKQCIQLETQIKESEDNFIQEKNKFNEIECIMKKEQNYEEAALLKQRIETDLHVADDQLQSQLRTNTSLEIEIDEQQTSFNDLLVNEQSAIQSLTMKIPHIYDELADLQGKLNDVEMKMVHTALENQRELTKIENDAQMALQDTNEKCSKVSEQIDLLEREAEEQVADMDKRYDTQCIEYQTQLEQTRNECTECLRKIEQGEINFQSKLLECDILARKVKFGTHLLVDLTNTKDSKNNLFRPPSTYRKRQVDYMSDSSLEGALAVDEYLKNKKAREQRKLAKSAKKSAPSKNKL